MKNILTLLAILLLFTACTPQTIQLQVDKQDKLPPLLTVKAEGLVKVNPDQLQLRLGVITEDKDAGAALSRNNQRMATVMGMLQEIGIGETERGTGQFQIAPEWSRPPRPTPANWEPAIIGYQVSNEVLINTTQVELAGKLLALAQQAGANQIGGLQFGLADPEAHRQRAIEIATVRAGEKAETLAKAAGIKLAGVQSISLDSSSPFPQPRMMLAEARAASTESVPVAAGQVEVSASVTIVYRLAESAEK